MNFIKKASLLLLVFTLFSKNIGCMNFGDSGETSQDPKFYEWRYEKTPDHPDLAPRPKKAKPIIHPQLETVEKIGNLFDVLEYLIQLCSIYSIDNTNKTIVDTLAKTRMSYNFSEILLRIYKAHRAEFYVGLPMHLTYNIINVFARGNNIVKDFKISRDVKQISLNNIGRDKDKNLQNKKVYHYIWLSINKVLPFIVEKNTESWARILSILCKFSEFYRQNSISGMIASPKK